MKLFILTTDPDSLSNSDAAHVEVIARREQDKLICNFETYPDRTIKIDFNPVNGIVNLSFQLKPNEFLAVGDKNVKKVDK